MEKSKNGFMKRFDPNLINDVKYTFYCFIDFRFLEQIKSQQQKDFKCFIVRNMLFHLKYKDVNEWKWNDNEVNCS